MNAALPTNLLAALALAAAGAACGTADRVADAGARDVLLSRPDDMGTSPALDAARGDGVDDGVDAGAEDSSENSAEGGTDAGADARVPDDTATPSDGGRCAPGPVATDGGAARGVVNADPRFVQVFVNNVENLKEPTEQCRGDWTDLIYYMRQARSQPDLFLVQQVSNRAQLDRLVQAMNAQLQGTYAGVIAEADPRRAGSPCGPEKEQQTNAIVYRTERFSPVGGKHTWQSFAMTDGSCQRSGLPRTMGVMQKFRDRVAARDVTVVSLHWSTNSGTGPDPACSERNIADVDQTVRMPGYEAALLLVGGDTNESDHVASGSYRPWYRRANGDLGGALGFHDPIYSRCARTANLAQCLDNEWTIGAANRIDFLFARRADGCRVESQAQHTVSFEEADTAARQAAGSDSTLNYSDHRAVHAEIYY